MLKNSSFPQIYTHNMDNFSQQKKPGQNRPLEKTYPEKNALLIK